MDYRIYLSKSISKYFCEFIYDLGPPQSLNGLEKWMCLCIVEVYETGNNLFCHNSQLTVKLLFDFGRFEQRTQQTAILHTSDCTADLVFGDAQQTEQQSAHILKQRHFQIAFGVSCFVETHIFEKHSAKESAYLSPPSPTSM